MVHSICSHIIPEMYEVELLHYQREGSRYTFTIFDGMVVLVCFDHLFGMTFTLHGLTVSLGCLVGFVLVVVQMYG